MPGPGRRAKQIITFTVAVAALTLTGCAADRAEPTPTATSATAKVSANQDACDAFAASTAGMADALNADDISGEWAKVRAQMDAASLEAEGDVKERLSALVDKWPDAAELWIHQDFDAINTMLKDIGRACDADDATSPYQTFVTE